jgi:phosphatidylglycerophosphate synthase
MNTKLGNKRRDERNVSIELLAHNEKTTIEIIKIISSGRDRTNILRVSEQRSIAFLVQHIPDWISSNMLTGIGIFGNFIVFLSFFLATYYHRGFLLIGVFGFMISWFGDSLDGRIAYYRNKARKWYGFTLDLTTDWIGTILIGLGFILYVDQRFVWIGYLFIVLYGWELITTVLRYKIIGKYSIDSGLFGPTEVRIIVSAILITEVLSAGSINIIGIIACAGLLISNLLSFIKLLKQADDLDHTEKS